MNFYVISQHGSGGWGQQYNMQLEPASARTYEPAALLPRTTFGNAFLLLRFYQFTGDRKYLAHVPDAISWLEQCRLPQDMTDNGQYTHPTFIEVGTNKPVFVHRKGSNVTYGYYYEDSIDKNLLAHYGGKTRIDIERLKAEYKRVSALSPEEATKNSPLIPDNFKGEGLPQTYYKLNRETPFFMELAADTKVKEVISALDSHNRWLVKHAMISNPYIGDGENKAITDDFSSVHVGDKTDTSPFKDPSDQLYISTGEYARNMTLLINYLKSVKDKKSVEKKAVVSNPY
jgi:hypothetical protein